MILDKLSNIGSYAALSPELGAVCELLGRVDIATLPDGKNLLDGDRLYANVSHCYPEPWDTRRFEGHRDYIDVQCVLSGSELMGYANVKDTVPCCDYNKETDLVFFDEPMHSSRLHLSTGMFAVFMPDDAHKPNCQLDSESFVHKVVIKAKINAFK